MGRIEKEKKRGELAEIALGWKNIKERLKKY